MTDDIEKFHPEISCFHEEWIRNRHVIDGARAMRLHFAKYLPCGPNQLPHEHEALAKRVPFFPAASRTHDGLIGLMFRKGATVTAPDNVKDILNTITVQGFSADDLAQEIVSELLITNFVGLLVDHPSSSAGMSRADAVANGLRPFVALYRAESIIDVEVGVVGNQQTITRVKMFDDHRTIRDLQLINGQYTVTIWSKSEGTSWVAGEPIVPTKSGQPLNRIPFTLVSTSKKFRPTKAPLNDLCEHNIQHYLARSNLATVDYYSAAPIYIIAGAKAGIYPVAPGILWQFDDKDVETKILEFTGTTVAELRTRVQDIQDNMASLGLRILASDKKGGVESADALAIRRVAENATTATIARVASRGLNTALDMLASWLDLAPGSIVYEINTDFNALPLNYQDITARIGLVQAGLISHDAFIDMLIDGEALPESFDKMADKEKIMQEQADAPPVTPPLPPIPAPK